MSTGNDQERALELRDVTVAYSGRPAVEGVTLCARPGEALAFVGPSGSGKSTLLKLLSGMLLPDTGAVHVEGHDLSRLSPPELRALRTRVGIVHQDLALVPNLRVLQNVMTGGLGRLGTWRGVRSVLLPPRRAVEEVHELLELVGIADKLYERTSDLSGGERQRVAIARALYQRPTLLLADEPVSALDPARSRDVLELLLSISRQRDLTLVLSMHDLELARAALPRLIGLRGGRLAFDSEAADVRPDMLSSLFDLGDQDPHAG